MTPIRVAAVLAGGSPTRLARQTEAVPEVFAGPGALARARACDADWLWFLAARARVREDALQRLLGAVEPEAEPRAALVAGMVLDERDGRPVEDELPAPDPSDIGVVIRVIPRHLCPIRHATLANCLVARAVLQRHGEPDTRRFGRYAAVEWTARVLRSEPGRFCADAVAVLSPAPGGDAPARPTLAAAAATLRMARTGAWTRGESLQALGRLAAGANLTRR